MANCEKLLSRYTAICHKHLLMCDKEVVEV